MNHTINQFAVDELEHTLQVLTEAIDNHREWFDKLHTSILCKQPFAADILHQAAHTQCKLGQWYYSDASDAVKAFKEFWELESVHLFMHDNARHLAQRVLDGEGIPLEEYQAFLGNQHKLIELLSAMRDTLIEYRYSFDALTGSLNRKSITLLLDRAYENLCRYSQDYSLAMVDIDNFKSINDQYGHLVGDEVLRQLSEFFQKSLRRSDSVGRYGGEEFLIMLPETSIDRACEIMQIACKKVTEMVIEVEQRKISVTFSAGISEAKLDDVDAWAAVKRADIALYQAKDAGRNCVVKAE
jgi:diguanylate cyclase (GGDEF)-like protein